MHRYWPRRVLEGAARKQKWWAGRDKKVSAPGEGPDAGRYSLKIYSAGVQGSGKSGLPKDGTEPQWPGRVNRKGVTSVAIKVYHALWQCQHTAARPLFISCALVAPVGQRRSTASGYDLRRWGGTGRGNTKPADVRTGNFVLSVSTRLQRHVSCGRGKGNPSPLIFRNRERDGSRASKVTYLAQNTRTGIEPCSITRPTGPVEGPPAGPSQADRQRSGDEQRSVCGTEYAIIQRALH